MSSIATLGDRVYPWQRSQWEHIQQLYNADRMPHALLLTGNAGIGKAQFATHLAHSILCDQSEFSDACGHCRQCGFNALATHPDMHMVGLEEKSQQIKIDQIRGLVDSLSCTAQQGGHKVAMIKPAESMNANAANALLKCLEEPAPNTFIILIADVAGQLLPTIRSRCQQLVFTQPQWEASLEWLRPQLTAETDFNALKDESLSQPLLALALAGNEQLARRQEMSRDFLALLSNKLSPLVLAEKWLVDDKLESLTWLGNKLSNIIRYRVAGSAVPLSDEWVAVANRVDVQRLYRLLDTLNQLIIEIKKGANPNYQLVLEKLFMESRENFRAGLV